MKSGIHPTYHNKANVKCACGASYTIGSTDEEINVDICSACHPFYTGKQKLLDAAGRVDKFRARMAAAQKSKPAKTEKVEAASEPEKNDSKADKIENNDSK